MAEDEPRCDQLRKINAELREKMFTTKRIQENYAEEVENLKSQKSELIAKKVSWCCYAQND
jgi:kinetochore protein Nuf2